MYPGQLLFLTVTPKRSSTLIIQVVPWQSITDDSGTYTWTAHGDAGHDTTESVGSSSLKFDGSGDYLKASGSWWHFRGNWNGQGRTVEMWFNTDSGAGFGIAISEPTLPIPLD